jgi:tRNA A22 N-methylase
MGSSKPEILRTHLLDSELVAAFVDEFYRELKRLEEASTKGSSLGNRRLEEIKKKIARIVSALAP